MRRLLVLPPLIVMLLCGFLAVSDDPARIVNVQDIRFGENASGETRVVFDLDARPDFMVGAVDGDAAEIVVHLDGGQFGFGSDDGLRPGLGLVKDVTYAANLARLRLTQTALPVRSFVLPPTGEIAHFRLVIDLEPASTREFAAMADAFRAPLQQKTAPSAPATDLSAPAILASLDAPARKLPMPPSLKPSRVEPVFADLPPLPAAQPIAGVKARPLIVLDPGHGGRDPGAIGRSGTREKDVTLSYAAALKATLETRGYDVLLTRSDDAYIRHEDRIGLARDRGADLFMSIHADSLDDSSLRGASVYTLDQRRGERLEDDIRRDGNFVLYDVEVSSEDGVGDILLDLAHSAAIRNSDRLANALLENMGETMPLLKNPKRNGALLVLLSPDVPAVLVELAFLSNPKDEANLKSTTWRRSAVTAIADGVDAYFDSTGLDTRLAGGVGGSG
ncbi:MAG: N-acetylmuramoyl-L-alanine amidase [Pseudomonadota bacterium]